MTKNKRYRPGPSTPKVCEKCGNTFLRHGANHDVWTNGSQVEALPRHREINELLAKKIIRVARQNPGKKV